MVIELALWGVPQSRRRGYATVLVQHAIGHAVVIETRLTRAALGFALISGP
jgi:hypothetical protein